MAVRVLSWQSGQCLDSQYHAVAVRTVPWQSGQCRGSQDSAVAHSILLGWIVVGYRIESP